MRGVDGGGGFTMLRVNIMAGVAFIHFRASWVAMFE